MSMGSTLELIQSFNDPKIIDALDSSLQEGKLHRGWKTLIILRYFLQLPKLFIEMEDKLFSRAFKVIIYRTVLVTYWASLLFSEARFEDVFICSLSSFHPA